MCLCRSSKAASANLVPELGQGQHWLNAVGLAPEPLWGGLGSLTALFWRALSINLHPFLLSTLPSQLEENFSFDANALIISTGEGYSWPWSTQSHGDVWLRGAMCSLTALLYFCSNQALGKQGNSPARNGPLHTCADWVKVCYKNFHEASPFLSR